MSDEVQVSEELLDDLDSRFAQLEEEDERERLAELGLSPEDDPKPTESDDDAQPGDSDPEQEDEPEEVEADPDSGAEDEAGDEAGTPEPDDQPKVPTTPEEKLALIVSSAVDMALRKAGVAPTSSHRAPPPPDIAATIRNYDARAREIDGMIAKLEEGYEEQDTRSGRVRIENQIGKLQAHREELELQKDEQLASAGRRSLVTSIDQQARQIAVGINSKVPDLPSLPHGFWLEVATGLQTYDPEVMEIDATTDPAAFSKRVVEFARSRGYTVAQKAAPPTPPRKKIQSSMPTPPQGAGRPAAAKPPSGNYRHTTDDLAVLTAYGVQRDEIARYEAQGKKHPYLNY